MKKLLLINMLVVFASTLLAQQGPSGALVQNSPTELRACTPAHADAAVNTTVTLTIPTPPSGQSIYLCGLDLSVSNDATGAVVSTNLAFTSTNFGGWKWVFSSANAASSNSTQVFSWTFGAKSPIPGTAVTFVSPAINLHAAYSINAYYYYAP